MISKAYFDESGGPDTRSFIVGGFLGQSPMWKDFSDEWQRVLNEDPAISLFHMIEWEAAKVNNQITKSEYQRKLDKLVSVIRRFEPEPFIVKCDSSDYAKICKGKTSRYIAREDHPYLAASQVLLTHMLYHWKVNNGTYNVIDVFFDEQQQFKKIQNHVREFTKDWMATRFAHLGEHLNQVTWIESKNKQLYVPLQAADLLVWHYRRKCDHRDGPTRPTYIALERIYGNRKPMFNRKAVTDRVLQVLVDGFNDPENAKAIMRKHFLTGGSGQW
jgi:uncharacterized protein DUF3800